MASWLFETKTLRLDRDWKAKRSRTERKKASLNRAWTSVSRATSRSP